MRLTSNNPKEAGRIDATLSQIKRHNFELVEAYCAPGEYYRVRCIKCGHGLKLNQHIWRFRHYMKCSEGSNQ